MQLQQIYDLTRGLQNARVLCLYRRAYKTSDFFRFRSKAMAITLLEKSALLCNFACWFSNWPVSMLL